ncbi:response regulator [Archaeoglobus sp.]
MGAEVLVVDDDCGICELYKEILRKFKVISACSGKEGLELYRKFKPELIVVDIKMPDMNGVEVTKEILKLNPNAVVIAVTAYRKEFEEKILAVGAKEVLEKPFNIEDLRNRILKYLNKGS